MRGTDSTLNRPTIQDEKLLVGGNEYGQCGEELEQKNDSGRRLSGDIVIPQHRVARLSVRQVAAGGVHSVVLTREGHVWTWVQPWPPGDIKKISVPVRVQGLERVQVIAIRAFHNLALEEDGILWAWGDNEYGQLGTGDVQPRAQPVPIQGLFGVTLVAIAGGGWHSTALTYEGQLPTLSTALFVTWYLSSQRPSVLVGKKPNCRCHFLKDVLLVGRRNCK
ncbi:hypothetical protein Ancab_006270 [Ancistrocladus abbreviatus]